MEYIEQKTINGKSYFRASGSASENATLPTEGVCDGSSFFMSDSIAITFFNETAGWSESVSLK